jgi:hypothetical protein
MTESVGGFDFYPVNSIRIVGKDRKGAPLHDGDRVTCFNHAPNPAPATIRRGPGHDNLRDMLWVVYDDGSSTGCIPDDPKFGVEKRPGED